MRQKASIKPTIFMAVAAVGLTFAPAANATVRTFDLSWSGANVNQIYLDPNNSAVATGRITIDDTMLPNPGLSGFDVPAASLGILAFQITISGAQAGNGTFSLANGDFEGFIWDTGGATLDLTHELVGQTTPGGPWGPGGSGDFNFFASSPGGPEGIAPFEFTSNHFGEVYDALMLTSFRPAVSEPGTLAIFGLGLAGLALTRRDKKA